MSTTQTPLPPPAPSLLSITRSSEITLLRSLLSPHRCVAPLLIWGPRSSGKTSMVLSVLLQNGAHFAYADGALQSSDRFLLRRISAQIQDRAIAPRIALMMLSKQKEKGAAGMGDKQQQQQEAQMTAAAAAAAAGGELKDDSDFSLLNSLPIKRGRGRPPKKLAKIRLEAALTNAMQNDQPVHEIPMHPPEIMDDITTRGAEGAAQAVAPSADKMDESATASANPAAPATASAAVLDTSAASLQSSTRSQLTELVRCIGSIRGHLKLPEGVEPPTLYLVIDNPQRLIAANPTLLASLCSIRQYTNYPVILVLIGSSFSSPDTSVGFFGLPRHLSNEFIVVPIRPYTVEESAEIIADKLWRTNRFISLAFRTAWVRDTTETTPPPEFANMSYYCFKEFIVNYLQGFWDLLSNDLVENEQLIREILPHYLTLLRQRLIGMDLLSESFDVSALTGSLLIQLDAEIKQRRKNVWKHEGNTCVPPNDAASTTAVIKKQPSLQSSAAASSSVTPLAAAAAAAANTSVSSASTTLLQLSRTSKLLLLASFLGSYNPASVDTSLFTSTRAKWNRRGKSAAVERKRKAFDSEASSNQRQLTQLELGPNAAPLERILAIYQALCESDEDRLGGLSACYNQLKALLAAQLIEQVALGSNKAVNQNAARNADLLTGIKIRCLVSMEEMERVCDSMDTAAVSGPDGPRMGEKITLRAYLYEGAGKGTLK